MLHPGNSVVRTTTFKEFLNAAKMIHPSDRATGIDQLRMRSVIGISIRNSNRVDRKRHTSNINKINALHMLSVDGSVPAAMLHCKIRKLAAYMFWADREISGTLVILPQYAVATQRRE